MFGGLVSAVLNFVHQYGYVAVFVYLALETSFILHFVPSEVVVPFAAAELVHGPASFVFFVADATAGATTGSLLAYVVFGRYGERVLDRYGRFIHVSETDIERSQQWFITYGESSVFWGRMLPFLRALVSIPAGLAEMRLAKFTLYSAAGAAVFNTVLTYLVYTGSGTTSPLMLIVSTAKAELLGDVAYVNAHVDFVVALAALLVLAAAVVWFSRDWIRTNPALAKEITLHTVRVLGVLVGTVFVLAALVAPGRDFSLIVSLWEEPGDLLALGFSEQVALLLTGVLIAFIGALCYELGGLVDVNDLEALGSNVRRVLRC